MMIFTSRTRWIEPPAAVPARLRRSAVANAMRNWLAAALRVREPKPKTSPPTKPRPGRVLQPDRGDLGAWYRLVGWRIAAGYDLAEAGGIDTRSLVGTVHDFRIDNGQPVLVIGTGAARILIDPRWWQIIALVPERRPARAGWHARTGKIRTSAAIGIQQ